MTVSMDDPNIFCSTPFHDVDLIKKRRNEQNDSVLFNKSRYDIQSIPTIFDSTVCGQIDLDQFVKTLESSILNLSQTNDSISAISLSTIDINSNIDRDQNDQTEDSVPSPEESIDHLVRVSGGPWSGRERAPSVHLTAWRSRSNDFTADPAQVAEDSNGNEFFYGDENPNGDDGCQRLAPETLPRLYPEWTLGIPFLFDESTEEESKGCCGSHRLSHSTLVRWFILLISLIGLACVIVGVVLGALMASASSRLTLSLLMIGAGVILITVSGLAWRLTSLEVDCLARSPCFLSATNSMPRQRSATTSTTADLARPPYSRVGRRRLMSHQYFAEVFQNPEFAWRPPPPSYQTAMRERLTRSILGHRFNVGSVPSADSPPPTYRSRDGTIRPAIALVNQLFRANSRPPSYSANEASHNVQTPFSIPSLDIPSQADAAAMVLVPPYQEIATPDTDDQASLVVNEDVAMRSWSPVQESCCTIGSNATSDHLLTIIDCSEPVPIGFELRRGRRTVSFLPNGGYHSASGFNDPIFRQSYV